MNEVRYTSVTLRVCVMLVCYVLIGMIRLRTVILKVYCVKNMKNSPASLYLLLILSVMNIIEYDYIVGK